ncbi:MAG: Na+/H+ antiporter NhaC family protein [Deltaproteobacteria bacterium]|nr:Na+/H+ antiporter NhaC family protein [Deltaproteobacteria bacterium]
MEHHGILSVLPPVIAIALAFLTRQVLVSLLVAIWVGATILSGWNPIAGYGDTFVTYIVGSLADPWKAGILIFSIVLGGMIGVTSKSGGATAIAEWLAGKAKGPRGGQIATWAMGLIIFFDDYSNTLLVGNTMRPLTDKLRISREKLSYICDSTAAPVASMAFISTWIAYEMGLMRDAFSAIGADINIYEAFIYTIPFRFYSIVTLFFVLAVAWFNRDYGPMRKAELRARETGKVLADGAIPLASKELTDMKLKPGTPLRALNAIIPVCVVVFGVMVGLYINGKGTILGGDDSQLIASVKVSPFAFTSIRDIIGNADASVAMTWAAFSGSIAAILMAVSQKILSLQEAIEAWLDGAKSLIIAAAVLLLAWGIGSLCENLGTANYLVGVLGDAIPLWIVPLMVFILCCIIAFATGTAWGTTAIMMPIAVPLAHHLGAQPDSIWILATIGSVFTGAVFGDHCSPISDTTVMSSMACACDHIDHVKTQIPYAMSTAGISIVFGYLLLAAGLPVFVCLAVCIAAAFLVVRFCGKPVDGGLHHQGTE